MARTCRFLGAVALTLTMIGCGGTDSTSTGDSQSVSNANKVPDSGASDTGAAAPSHTAEGWGAIKGTFVYQGDPPDRARLSTGGKDSEVCEKHEILDESLLVDSATRGIANIVVYARKTSRTHEQYVQPTDEEVVFDQKDCVFLSHVLPVRLDQTLLIKNSDPISHNTNISPRGDVGINPLLAANGELTHQFGRQQSFPVAVTCNIHPWMRAYVLPRENPYVVVTGADGSFEIAHLPAGEEIEFQVWHERAGGSNGGLVAQPMWDRGRFAATIPADGVEDLGTIEVAPAAFK